jgi:hypothetical protein
MMGQPVHKFLEDFDGASDSSAQADPACPWEPRIAAARTTPITAAQLDEAYSKGLEVGIAEGWAMREGEIAQARADAEAQFRMECSQLSEVVQQQLSTGLTRQLEGFCNRLEDQLLDVLIPVLRFAIAENALREFVSELHDLAMSPGALAIELSGPAELVERVWQLHLEWAQAASEPPMAEVRVCHGASPEIRLVCGDKVVETRVGEWVGRISGVLG